MKLHYEPDLDEVFEIEGIKYRCVNQPSEYSACNGCCFRDRHPLCQNMVCNEINRLDDISVIIIKIS